MAKRTITVNPFDTQSIQAAIDQLDDYIAWLDRKCRELAQRLASMGATKASLDYSRAVYTGNRDVTVEVVEREPNKLAVLAGGETVLFVEFGAGVTYGYGHPQAAEFGYGPGTYPSESKDKDGNGNWNNPNGWYIPGGEHTYGNPPSMTMYNTAKDLRREVARIAQEVFAT